MESTEMIGKIAMFYVPFLFALCFHEFAHGWVAKKLGDPTAEVMGRVTMNPIVHMDIVGTVIFPILAIASSSPIFFGWAKPVPVSLRNLKNPKKDMFWIALAGPASNFFLALVGLLLLTFKSELGVPVAYYKLVNNSLQMFILLNLFLALFNLIPVHPLDGGKILARFLPTRANMWLEQNSSTISMGLFVLILLDAFNPGVSFIAAPVYGLYNFLAGIAGALYMSI